MVKVIVKTPWVKKATIKKWPTPNLIKKRKGLQA